MAVEDHPLFDEWKSRLEKLIEAKAAYKEGRASEEEVAQAQAEFNSIADEIDT